MDFKGKKVAVIGAGIEGVSTVNFLIPKGAQVSLLDKKDESGFEAKKLASLKNLPIKLQFGANYLNRLEEYDVIFRSPGVRIDLPEITAAKTHGAQVTSQTKLFFEECSAPIIGVTGTKGKGTTSSLIYEILKVAGRRVFLGGNIGKPPLDFLDQVSGDSLVVLELSSFQLTDLEKSPHIAVVLMITQEHLDWHENVDDYVESKKPIVKYQTEKDFVVINSDCETSREIGEGSKGQKFYFSTQKTVERGAYLDHDFIVSVTDGWTTIVKKEEIKIPGEHNLQNIAAAATVAGILEIPPATIQKAIIGFKGLPHRLEFVGEINGASYYNDSASTTPETAIAAIGAFENPKIVILGGSSKRSDFVKLGREIIEDKVKAVILIGKEADRIKSAINKAGHFSGQMIAGPKTMGEVVQKAKGLANKGDVVILSPACASFDMFKNYQDRGDQFKQAVNAL